MTRKDGLPRRVYPKHGRYYFVSPDGVWHGLTLVKDGLPAMLRALANLTDSEAASDRMPAVITRWLADPERDPAWAANTRRDMERLAAIMAARLIEYTPREVTAAVCRDYLKSYRATPRTHNQHRGILRAVLSFAATENLRDGHNPADDTRPMVLARRKRIVTDAELAALKEAAALPRQDAAPLGRMIDLAMITGQRISDVIGLRWQDVTADGLLIRQGKTDERLLIEWSPALRAAIDACATGDRIGHVLKTRSGGGYTYAGIRSAWDRCCERAGIVDLHIHDLRGRAGVDALEGAGQDVRAAQKLLGHKSEGMTRHYTDGKYHKRVKPAR